MATTLRLQLLISLNARLFKVYNLRDHKVFTISLLKKVLGNLFHIPINKIHFTLVSGRFTRDTDALYDLRASDGNFASLDIGISPAPKYHCSIAGAIISFEFRINPNPLYLHGVSLEGIQEVPLMTDTLRTIPNRLSSPSTQPNIPNQKLTKEQRIALRASLEDPFSITSKSCFEEDSDNESDYNDEEANSDVGDLDDDLYSDDGLESTDSEPKATNEQPPSTPLSLRPFFQDETASFRWPADPSKLGVCHLRRILSIVPTGDLEKEVPLRKGLLRFQFQSRIYNHLSKIAYHQAKSSISSTSSTSSSSSCSSSSSSSSISSFLDFDNEEFYSTSYQGEPDFSTNHGNSLKFAQSPPSTDHKNPQSKPNSLKVLITN